MFNIMHSVAYYRITVMIMHCEHNNVSVLCFICCVFKVRFVLMIDCLCVAARTDDALSLAHLDSARHVRSLLNARLLSSHVVSLLCDDTWAGEEGSLCFACRCTFNGSFVSHASSCRAVSLLPLVGVKSEAPVTAVTDKLPTTVLSESHVQPLYSQPDVKPDSAPNVDIPDATDVHEPRALRACMSSAGPPSPLAIAEPMGDRGHCIVKYEPLDDLPAPSVTVELATDQLCKDEDVAKDEPDHKESDDDAMDDSDYKISDDEDSSDSGDFPSSLSSLRPAATPDVEVASGRPGRRAAAVAASKLLRGIIRKETVPPGDRPRVAKRPREPEQFKLSKRAAKKLKKGKISKRHDVISWIDCVACDTRFVGTLSGLTQHVASELHVNKSADVTHVYMNCIRCNQRYLPDAMLSHCQTVDATCLAYLKRSQSKVFACQACTSTLPCCRQSVMTHLKDPWCRQSFRIHCSICDLTLTSFEDIDKHVDLHLLVTTILSDPDIANPPEPSLESILQLGYHSGSASVWALVHETYTRNKQRAVKCKRKKYNKSKRMESAHYFVFRCTGCVKHFKTAESLWHHARDSKMHQERLATTQLTCLPCDKSYSNIPELMMDHSKCRPNIEVAIES